MADMRQAFPSEYLSAKDIKETGPQKVTISAVTSEQVRGDHGLEDKWVLSFEGCRKRLILNVTNNNACIDAFGYESNDWLGQVVKLFTIDVQFGGKMVLGLRIKTDLEEAVSDVQDKKEKHQAVDESSIPF
mgnify:CR=1 FL=1